MLVQLQPVPLQLWVPAVHSFTSAAHGHRTCTCVCLSILQDACCFWPSCWESWKGTLTFALATSTRKLIPRCTLTAPKREVIYFVHTTAAVAGQVIVFLKTSFRTAGELQQACSGVCSSTAQEQQRPQLQVGSSPKARSAPGRSPAPQAEYNRWLAPSRSVGCKHGCGQSHVTAVSA